MKSLLAAALATSLLACSGGGTNQSTVAPPFGGTDTVVAIGHTMTDKNQHSVRVLGFQKTGSLPNGSQCLQVSVSMTNAARVAWQGPLASLRVDDSQGYAHYGLTPCGENPAMSTLDPGQSATAIVYFDVYPNTALNLTWTPDPAQPTVTYSTALK